MREIRWDEGVSPVSADDGTRKNSTRGQMTSEHRRLKALFAEVEAALAGGSEAREALVRLQEALDAHFEREDALYFPTLWTLRPDRKGPLLKLSRDHDGLRSQLRDLVERVAKGLRTEVQSAFEELAQAFTRHEEAEEQLLVSLEQEIHTVH
jgi:hemerythrin-like domain-containing protein